ncbi:MAG: XTP/dITP diphosphatase [Candidatus Altiarchaeota archaeon]
MKEVLFVTSNSNKVSEANRIGQTFGVTFSQVNLIYPEIRSDSVRAVAEEGVKYVHNQIQRPVVVEDSGLFIDALSGFPGAYSALVYKKIGCEGILKLMEGVDDRTAQFISAVGYCDKDTVEVFEGVVDGLIAYEARGKSGFAYDPLFQPADSGRTFAEDVKHKNEVSHRRKSIELLCRYLMPR